MGKTPRRGTQVMIRSRWRAVLKHPWTLGIFIFVLATSLQVLAVHKTFKVLSSHAEAIQAQGKVMETLGEVAIMQWSAYQAHVAKCQCSCAGGETL